MLSSSLRASSSVARRAFSTSPSVRALTPGSKVRRPLLQACPAALVATFRPGSLLPPPLLCILQIIMNRWSQTITQPKSQGASQAMLYATEGVEEQSDFEKAMVGIGSVWSVHLPSEPITNQLASWSSQEQALNPSFLTSSRYEGNP
jgi:hypothetical protein